MNNNTPQLQTERLILRKFTPDDIESLFLLLKDTDVNKFLPWFPLKTLTEASDFYEKNFAETYRQKCGYKYAVCLKSDNMPIGYIVVSMDDSHDMGYASRKEFWNKGIIKEAAKAVVEQLKSDRIPYITATHDVNNPQSGSVMKAVGMQYKYSYAEQWQPKNLTVIFVCINSI